MPGPFSLSCSAPHSSHTSRCAWRSIASRTPASSWSSTLPSRMFSRRYCHQTRRTNQPCLSLWNGCSCSPPQASVCLSAGCFGARPINAGCCSRVQHAATAANVARGLADAHVQDHQIRWQRNGAAPPGNACRIGRLRCARCPPTSGPNPRSARPRQSRRRHSSRSDSQADRCECGIALPACGSPGDVPRLHGFGARSVARAQRALERAATGALRRVAHLRPLLQSFLQRHRSWIEQLCQSGIRQTA
ncbi:hypothetical protein NB721_001442 [Xanthomonas sacchari]|nr:hypothetical protein [Xanthomonas sacchari]